MKLGIRDLPAVAQISQLLKCERAVGGRNVLGADEPPAQNHADGDDHDDRDNEDHAPENDVPDVAVLGAQLSEHETFDVAGDGRDSLILYSDLLGSVQVRFEPEPCLADLILGDFMGAAYWLWPVDLDGDGRDELFASQPGDAYRLRLYGVE